MSFESEFESAELESYLKSISSKTNEVKEFKTKYANLISILVFQDISDHFRKEMGSEGKWKPWSEFYKKQIASDNPPRSPGLILQATGNLRNNFKPTNFRNQSNGILWYNNAKTKENSFPYAFAHNEGGSKLPKRDFMWLSQNAIEKISQQTLAFILEQRGE